MSKAFDRAVLERELGIVTYALHRLGPDLDEAEREELEQRQQGLFALLDAAD